MFGLKNVKTLIEVKTLEAKAEVVFNVLNSHNVFGKLEGLGLEVERRGFINSITDHATGDDNRNYLELTYPSCVRLIINTMIFAGEADFMTVEAYDHPWKNDKMDYEALNHALTTSLLWFGEW